MLTYLDTHLASFRVDEVAVEMVGCYGMAVGATVFETCVWIGRFWERITRLAPTTPITFVFRKEVKMHLCGCTRAKDTNVNRVLIDKFGDPTSKTGKGSKSNPSQIYGFNNDRYAALAVAVTFAETKCHNAI